MSGLRYKVNIPSGISGNYKVVNNEYDGDYTVLYQFINNKWMNIMEDTELEAIQASAFLSAATGDVLLAGLGLGMVLKPLVKNPKVSSITVIEKYQEVIDLISPHTPSSNKIKIINDDIYTWIPDKPYDVAWFDSYIYPADGEFPVGTYLVHMENKYKTFVRTAYFWPGPSVYNGHLGW
tara:strand:+ start:235 stop:771 length:537 start_codon:yes stop_codon:yes gene_type:complete